MQARALNSGPRPSAAWVDAGAAAQCRSNSARPISKSRPFASCGSVGSRTTSCAGLAWAVGAKSAIISAAERLRHQDISHHTGFLMLDDMTVEHPGAGIVGDE